ncbi:MAG TPA: HAD-IIB family hydrolase [Aliidongia sp.]|nr:HAD-IIB family hydrolase [Aliidongia sp.]
MYFLALAVDYDGTIARDGVVDPATCEALRRLKSTGRRLILVTGRELPDLRRQFSETALFDRIVAENGALLHDPSNGRETLLAAPAPRSVVERLAEMKVAPVSVGRCIIATWEPHQAAVLEVIHELGLELQVIFNKGAVMILPPNVNKASGLLAALKELDLSPHNVAAVGDAENDHAFLGACGLAAAVANALPAVKRMADIVLAGDHGAGVAELAQRLIAEDATLAPKTKHGLMLGRDRAGMEIYLQPYGGSVLIIGPSASGKSTLATALTEHIAEKEFEFCVVDPEGDYVDLEDAVCVGGPTIQPVVAEALKLLHENGVNLVMNTQALGLKDRRRLFASFLLQISRLRQRTGRPHWLIIDEAHQVLPAARDDALRGWIDAIPAAIMITAYPQEVAREALETVTAVIAVGDEPFVSLAACAAALGTTIATDPVELSCGEALLWAPGASRPPQPVKVEPPIQIHKRHAGKYAVGDVGESRSFYFRNPRDGTLISARNLYRFLDVAGAVDDGTWERHLRAGDYSAWFRHVIKDEELACEAARVEQNPTLDAYESRRLIRKAVWRRYAGPTGG